MLKYVNMHYLNWCNGGVVNKFIKYNQNKNLERLRENVKKNLNKRDTLFYAIFFKDKHIGHIKCERINFKKSFAHLDILIGDKKFKKKGAEFEIIDKVCDELFYSYNISKVFSDVVKKSLGQAGDTLDAKSSAEFTKMFKDFMLEKAPLEQAISEALADGKSDNDLTFYNNKEYKVKDLKDLLQESVAGKLTEIQGRLAEKRFKQFEKVSQKFLDVLDGKTNISLEVLPSELFKTTLKSARDSGEIEEIKDQSNIELKDLVEGEGIYFTKSGKIFVNQDYAKDILNFTVTGHEVLHPIMNAALGKMSAEKRINFINEFKQALPEEVRNIVQDRINKRQDITDKDFTVEWFNMTSDALSELKGFNVSKMQKAGDAISNMFKRNINPDVEFNFGKNGADAFMFIKRYADFVSGKSDIVLEKSLPSLVEEGFKVDVDANVGSQRSVTTPEGKIIENLRDFDKLNWKKYNTKQEFQRSPEFIAATDFLYQSRAFETQIKNKLFEGDPNDVKSDLAIHLSNFDPAQQKGKGGSLGAWMGSQFINKVSGVGKKAEKQKTERQKWLLRDHVLHFVCFMNLRCRRSK